MEIRQILSVFLGEVFGGGVVVCLSGFVFFYGGIEFG